MYCDASKSDLRTSSLVFFRPLICRTGGEDDATCALPDTSRSFMVAADLPMLLERLAGDCRLLGVS